MYFHTIFFSSDLFPKKKSLRSNVKFIGNRTQLPFEYSHMMPSDGISFESNGSRNCIDAMAIDNESQRNGSSLRNECHSQSILEELPNLNISLDDCGDGNFFLNKMLPHRYIFK